MSSRTEEQEVERGGWSDKWGKEKKDKGMKWNERERERGELKGETEWVGKGEKNHIEYIFFHISVQLIIPQHAEILFLIIYIWIGISALAQNVVSVCSGKY